MQPYENPQVIVYSGHLAASFAARTKREIVQGAPGMTPQALAKALYLAPFVLVSHGTQPDPIFCYANKTAQELWGYSWDEFTSLPSRLSAEAQERGGRSELLKQAQQNGMIENYAGIRISKSGKRFRIEDTALWNVDDTQGAHIGQAAIFSRWTPVA